MIDGLRARWEREPPEARLALLAIVLSGVLVRWWALAQPMRHDEAASYLALVGRSWGTALSSYPLPGNHLLYTVVAKLSATVGGAAPWVLRLPAFLAGIALIPLTYAVGRVLFTRGSALLASALVAAATPLILYSANARGYAWVVAAYAILLLVGARIRDHGPSPRRWAAFAGVAAVGMATAPLVMVYPLAAVTVWLGLAVLVRGRSSARTLLGLGASVLAAILLATAAYAPIIATNGIAALASDPSVLPSRWPHFYASLLPSLAGTFASWTRPYPVAVAVALGAATVIAVLRPARDSREGVPVLLAAYVAAAAILLVGHHAPPARAWVWLFPVVALTIGSFIDHLLQRPRLSGLGPYLPGIAAAVAAAGIAWGLVTNALGTFRDTGVFAGAEPIADVLATQAERGDRVVVAGPAQAPLRYYMLRAGADTAMLSTPESVTTREILVLDATDGQTVAWAVAAGMVDTARFGPIAPATHARDANVYVAERREHGP